MKIHIYILIITILFKIDICNANPISSSTISDIFIQSRKTIPNKPKFVRGIHITSWALKSVKKKKYINELLFETELNTAVIDIKEGPGRVFVPVPKLKKEYGTPTGTIPKLKKYLELLKRNEIYTVARIVVFKDDFLARKRPDLAIQSINGGVWRDPKKGRWLDPYKRETWEYMLQITDAALDVGFEEIQYDYIRFPSDGNVKECSYDKNGSTDTFSDTIIGFLKEANKRIKSRGANLSVDLFGLTTTSKSDMGIGQKIVEISKWVDYVSPMIYPSHYFNNEYGINNLYKSPYSTVYFGVKDGVSRLGNSAHKLRPFLQDFSWRYKYGKKEVLAQIQACYDNNIAEWLLWNPSSIYTREALKDKNYSGIYSESKDINALIKKEAPEVFAKKPEAPNAPDTHIMSTADNLYTIEPIGTFLYTEYNIINDNSAKR